MRSRASAVTPRDGTADGELRLFAAVHTGESLRPHSSPGKAQSSEIQARLLLNVYWFCTIVKSQIPKSGVVCTDQEGLKWFNYVSHIPTQMQCEYAI